jgi:hypothetical protein
MSDAYAKGKIDYGFGRISWGRIICIMLMQHGIPSPPDPGVKRGRPRPMDKVEAAYGSQHASMPSSCSDYIAATRVLQFCAGGGEATLCASRTMPRDSGLGAACANILNFESPSVFKTQPVLSINYKEPEACPFLKDILNTLRTGTPREKLRAVIDLSDDLPVPNIWSNKKVLGAAVHVLLDFDMVDGQIVQLVLTRL